MTRPINPKILKLVDSTKAVLIAAEQDAQVAQVLTDRAIATAADTTIAVKAATAKVEQAVKDLGAASGIRIQLEQDLAKAVESLEQATVGIVDSATKAERTRLAKAAAYAEGRVLSLAAVPGVRSAEIDTATLEQTAVENDVKVADGEVATATKELTEAKDRVSKAKIAIQDADLTKTSAVNTLKLAIQDADVAVKSLSAVKETIALEAATDEGVALDHAIHSQMEASEAVWQAEAAVTQLQQTVADSVADLARMEKEALLLQEDEDKATKALEAATDAEQAASVAVSILFDEEGNIEVRAQDAMSVIADVDTKLALLG